MKKLRLGDFILGTICGIVIVVGVVNINHSNSPVQETKIQKSK